jgi:uncharacterized protein (DUF2147 family)
MGAQTLRCQRAAARLPALVAASLAAMVACLSATPAQAEDAAPQAGRWITESGNLEVEIAPCAKATARPSAGSTHTPKTPEPVLWCGTVTRVLANRSMQAPGTVMEPVDKRPALGMQILSGLHTLDDGQLDGDIYNRENGKTYSVRLTPDGPQQLLVRPYIVLPLIGKTQLWRRASAAAAEVAP